MPTNRITTTDEWQPIGPGPMLLQGRSKNPARVHCGEASPGEDSQDAFEIVRDGPMLPYTGTDTVYVRSHVEGMASSVAYAPIAGAGGSGLTDDELGARMGAADDTEATGDGTLIAIAKRMRTLLGTLVGWGAWLTNTQLRATPIDVAVVSGGGGGQTDAEFGARFGATTDAEVASGNATAIALLKRLRTLLTGVAGGGP